jgi:hypothetical protein
MVGCVSLGVTSERLTSVGCPDEGIDELEDVVLRFGAKGEEGCITKA